MLPLEKRITPVLWQQDCTSLYKQIRTSKNCSQISLFDHQFGKSLSNYVFCSGLDARISFYLFSLAVGIISEPGKIQNNHMDCIGRSSTLCLIMKMRCNIISYWEVETKDEYRYHPTIQKQDLHLVGKRSFRFSL